MCSTRLKPLPRYCSYYHYLPVAPPREAQQQKLKAAYKFSGKRFGFVIGIGLLGNWN
ncbi:hypothetical protein HOLleu_12017 [Holothuria leucospilota]|uniref:Uncharacterized protein n=1 Tax=Holothuria leucospilota TaxID=206669 RepID=A0A9Q1C9L1_HOLLE|nr:hypothetical protein HOLleu_12017 [Holothuria leucospilota]